MTVTELLRYYELQTGAGVSLTLTPGHVESPRFRLAPDQDVHHNSACLAHKLAPGRISCLDWKDDKFRQAQQGRPFVMICEHGIWDWAQPVRDAAGTVWAVLYFTVSTGTPTREERRRIGGAAAELAHLLRIERYFADAEAAAGRKRHSTEYYLEQVQEFIDRRYQENIAFGELAERLGVTVQYLGGMVRRGTGRSFRELLTERRIRESLVYLKYRVGTISSIARRCGFADSNYFSTVFRKIMGESPRAYREREAAKAELKHGPDTPPELTDAK